MADIFTRNFDYILFLYTTGLFVLSSLCFIRPRGDGNDKLSFYYLGLFAFSQGAGEWMNIFSFAFGDSDLFLTIRIAVFIVSYFFLFNLAAHGVHILFLRPIKKWVYLFLAVLCLFSFIYLGPKGTFSVIHFFFALLVGVYSALIIYLYSYKEKDGSSLRLFSLSLVFYFILRALAIPESSFFISRWVNYKLFNNLFGFPVQFALALIIFIAVFAFAVNTYRIISGIHTRYGRGAAAAGQLWTFLILAALVLTGSVFTFYWGIYTRGEKKKITLLRIENISSHIQSILDIAGEVAYSLADSGKAKDALKYRNTLAIEQLNDRLDNYVESFGLISACWVMDDKGFVIASSGRGKPTSFVGKNYAFRPYFKDALEGKQGNYFALDSASKERSFHASYPVKDEWGNVIGVSVVKVNIETAENILKSFPETFLVSPQGVIFASSDKRYLFRSFYPVENIYKQKIVSSRQFGKVNFNPLLKKECFQDDEVLLGNNLYYVFRIFIGYGGWSVVALWYNKSILIARFFCMSTTLFIVILFLLSAVILNKKEEIFSRVSHVSSEYKAILNATSGVIIISVDTEGRIISSNSGTERILGYKEYELKGRNIIDCIFVKDEVDNYAKVVAQETGMVLEGFYALVEKTKHNIIMHKQWSFIKKGGSVILVDLSITAKRGYKSEITGFIFTASDITAFKRIQEKLRDEKNRMAVYLDTALVIMLMLNRKGEVVFINKRGCQVLGHNSDEIIGKDWFSHFLPDEERDSTRDVFNRLIQGEMLNATTHTNYILTKKGKKLIFWHNAVVYDNYGQVINILSSGDDITERVEKEEELKEKLDELNKFQKFVVDRELKMRELKKRIKELEGDQS
ncbi:MAG: hypothetical protein B1H08_03860 [Candidatus Omnitrophica bacterium 4484_171]|nr:MAG: hypothetical protein B1H08_03860 [Candidatus Omnitrophica bacterium 4484_171]